MLVKSTVIIIPLNANKLNLMELSKVVDQHYLAFEALPGYLANRGQIPTMLIIIVTSILWFNQAPLRNFVT